jgi:hypothetical protein
MSSKILKNLSFIHILEEYTYFFVEQSVYTPVYGSTSVFS